MPKGRVQKIEGQDKQRQVQTGLHSCAVQVLAQAAQRLWDPSLEMFRSHGGVGLSPLLCCPCWSRSGTRGIQRALPPQPCCGSVSVRANTAFLAAEQFSPRYCRLPDNNKPCGFSSRCHPSLGCELGKK